jgi:heptosyltransferase-1
MRVLIVKTSSMGDVIHTLPAVTDAVQQYPDIEFDWVVEENFAEIPRWHPAVKKIIPFAWRRWRKNFFAKQTRVEWKMFQRELRAQKYDLIIDAQGLVKSALCARFAKGLHVGPNWNTAREPIAALFYKLSYPVDPSAHAVTRMRTLFSQALGYPLTDTTPDYGIDRRSLLGSDVPIEPYLVFLHGTTWATKHWPEAHWIQLARLAQQHGVKVKLPWGNDAERERAQRIAAGNALAEVLPRQDLIGMAKILAGAKAIAAVDTGLGHLAAALDVPCVSLYGPTDPLLTGALGKSQVHLTAKFPCAPCFNKVCTYEGKGSSLYPACFAGMTAGVVWGSLTTLL